MEECIIRPVATEKTMLQVEKENKLTFIVYKKSSKEDVKREVEERFSVKVETVNMLVTKFGKKAVVKLSPEFSADDIAGRIGIF